MAAAAAAAAAAAGMPELASASLASQREHAAAQQHHQPPDVQAAQQQQQQQQAAAAAAGRILFLVVVSGADLDCLEDPRPAGPRYTRDSLRCLLQLLGCKPRLAYKIMQGVFAAVGQAVTTARQQRISRTTFQVHPHRNGKVYVSLTRADFMQLVSTCAAEYAYKISPSSEELKVACGLRERRRCVVVLLCGTSGSGKSTLASILASRLGITTVVSTDSVRHMLRSFISQEASPLLWASTYQAGEHAGGSSKAGAAASDAERALCGYKAQCGLLAEQLEVLIAGCEARTQSLICEGVHLNISTVIKLMARHPSVLPFLVAIPSEAKHVERMAVRAKYMTLDPNKNRYVRYMGNIRLIQEYLARKADKFAVPCVDNSNMDRSVGIIHLTVMACLRRMARGEPVLDPTTRRTSMLAAEYAAVLDHLQGEKDRLAAATAAAATGSSGAAAARGAAGASSSMAAAASSSSSSQSVLLGLRSAGASDVAAAATEAAVSSHADTGLLLLERPHNPATSAAAPPGQAQQIDAASMCTAGAPTHAPAGDNSSSGGTCAAAHSFAPTAAAAGPSARGLEATASDAAGVAVSAAQQQALSNRAGGCGDQAQPQQQQQQQQQQDAAKDGLATAAAAAAAAAAGAAGSCSVLHPQRGAASQLCCNDGEAAPDGGGTGVGGGTAVAALASTTSSDSPLQTQQQHHVRPAATGPLSSSQQQRRPPRQQTQQQQQQQRQLDDSVGVTAADAAAAAAAAAAGDADDDVSSGEELDGLGELGSSDNEGERFLQDYGSMYESTTADEHDDDEHDGMGGAAGLRAWNAGMARALWPSYSHVYAPGSSSGSSSNATGISASAAGGAPANSSSGRPRSSGHGSSSSSGGRALHAYHSVGGSRARAMDGAGSSSSSSSSSSGRPASAFAGSAAAAGLLRMPAPAGDTRGSHARLPTVAEQQQQQPGGP